MMPQVWFESICCRRIVICNHMAMGVIHVRRKFLAICRRACWSICCVQSSSPPNTYPENSQHVVLRPSFEGCLGTDLTSKAANAHATLPVPYKHVLSCKASAAKALVGLIASVDFCMVLKIVLALKALAASTAPKLSVAEICLNVRV